MAMITVPPTLCLCPRPHLVCKFIVAEREQVLAAGHIAQDGSTYKLPHVLTFLRILVGFGIQLHPSLAPAAQRWVIVQEL